VDEWHQKWAYNPIFKLGVKGEKEMKRLFESKQPLLSRFIIYSPSSVFLAKGPKRKELIEAPTFVSFSLLSS